VSAIVFGLGALAVLAAAAGLALLARRRSCARRDAIRIAAESFARRLDEATREVEAVLSQLERRAPPGTRHEAEAEGEDASNGARIEVIARFRTPAARPYPGQFEPVSGLGDRSTLYETLVDEVERASRRLHPLTLLLIEVTCAGALEAAVGPPTVEGAIRELGGRLRDLLGADAVACRYAIGGLAVVMPGATRIDAESLLARLGASVARTPPAGLDRLSFSGGHAELGRLGCEDALAMLASAHRTLREADVGLDTRRGRG